MTHPNASKLPLKDSFTYDDYRWAVSSVMTRQNQIPAEDGSRVTLALIPLWDMCNHTNGLQLPLSAEEIIAGVWMTCMGYAIENRQITTGYNLEDDRCECVALQDFKPGEQ
ncbi:UNVERIFIED_CONTAM: Histone-lysine N-methyltransferase setd3, partial [Gekko kuhli]